MRSVLVVHRGELGELLVAQFEQYGVHATQATTGEDALEDALREGPAAIVVDNDLDDASGLDVAELLKAELNVPVIVTYDPAFLRGDDGDALLARLDALDARFVKPFRSLALITAVADQAGIVLQHASMLPSPAETPVDDDDVTLVLEDIEDAGSLPPIEVDLNIDFDNLDIDLESIDELNEVLDGQVGATESLTSFVAQTEHQDPTSLAMLWKRIRERGAPEAVSTARTKPPVSNHGTLGPKKLTQLLDAFHQSSTTGEISLTRGPKRRILLLAQGIVTGVRSNLPGESLVAVAEKRGIVDDDARARAVSMLQSGHVKNEVQALLDAGVPRPVVQRLVDERTRRVVSGAYLWKEGSFQLSTHGHGERELVPARVTIGDAIVRSIILTEPLDALRDAVPDDARFAPDGDASYALSDLALTGPEAHLVISMDGTKTMGDLAVLFDSIPERVHRGLAAGLHRIGVIRLVGRGAALARSISFF